MSDSKLVVLFLDIDGVIVTGRSILSEPRKQIAHRKPDMIAINFLNRMHDAEPNLRIVVSSSWRLMADVDDVLRAMGLAVPFFYTPKFDDEESKWWETSRGSFDSPTNWDRGLCTPWGGRRGEEIKMWLDRFGHHVDRWAIIDDDSDMLPEQVDRFVHTNFMAGISFENMQQLKELLLPSESPMSKEVVL